MGQNHTIYHGCALPTELHWQKEENESGLTFPVQMKPMEAVLTLANWKLQFSNFAHDSIT